MATQDIAAGEVFLAVPWDQCLSSEHLANRSDHPLAALARDNPDGLSSADLLALFLLYEYHNPSSQLAPYLCAHPSSPPSAAAASSPARRRRPPPARRTGPAQPRGAMCRLRRRPAAGLLNRQLSVAGQDEP